MGTLQCTCVTVLWRGPLRKLLWANLLIIVVVVLKFVCLQLRRVTEPCPIALMKCVKNDVEIAGMRSAHVSDSSPSVNWSLVSD